MLYPSKGISKKKEDLEFRKCGSSPGQQEGNSQDQLCRRLMEWPGQPGGGGEKGGSGQERGGVCTEMLIFIITFYSI